MERAKSITQSELTRLATPRMDSRREESYAALTCPIAVFDVRSLPSTQGQVADGGH